MKVISISIFSRRNSVFSKTSRWRSSSGRRKRSSCGIRTWISVLDFSAVMPRRVKCHGTQRRKVRLKNGQGISIIRL
jgi:hypothetical protein